LLRSLLRDSPTPPSPAGTGDRARRPGARPLRRPVRWGGHRRYPARPRVTWRTGSATSGCACGCLRATQCRR